MKGVGAIRRFCSSARSNGGKRIVVPDSRNPQFGISYPETVKSRKVGFPYLFANQADNSLLTSAGTLVGGEWGNKIEYIPVLCPKSSPYRDIYPISYDFELEQTVLEVGWSSKLRTWVSQTASHTYGDEDKEDAVVPIADLPDELFPIERRLYIGQNGFNREKNNQLKEVFGAIFDPRSKQWYIQLTKQSDTWVSRFDLPPESLLKGLQQVEENFPHYGLTDIYPDSRELLPKPVEENDNIFPVEWTWIYPDLYHKMKKDPIPGLNRIIFGETRYLIASSPFRKNREKYFHETAGRYGRLMYENGDDLICLKSGEKINANEKDFWTKHSCKLTLENLSKYDARLDNSEKEEFGFYYAKNEVTEAFTINVDLLWKDDHWETVVGQHSLEDLPEFRFCGSTEIFLKHDQSQVQFFRNFGAEKVTKDMWKISFLEGSNGEYFSQLSSRLLMKDIIEDFKRVGLEYYPGKTKVDPKTLLPSFK